MRIYTTSANFTRPANITAYGQSKLVANDTTAGNVLPMVFVLPIKGFLLFKVSVNSTNTTNTNAQFYLNLYTTIPTSAVGDGGTYSTNKSSAYLGRTYIDCTQYSFTDGFIGFGLVDPNLLSLIPDPSVSALNGPLSGQSGGQVYGLLETANTGLSYTPASGEIFTVTMYGYD